MTDRRIVLAVVLILGGNSVIGTLGMAVLAYQEKKIPTELVAVTTGAIGAVGALLVSTRTRTDDDPPPPPAPLPLPAEIAALRFEPAPPPTAPPAVDGLAADLLRSPRP